MNQPLWQLIRPLDAVIFDCDSTLSGVEGITVLATQNGVFQAVNDLTEKAMAETGLTLPLYQERLALVLPHASQMQAVVEAYWQNRTPDVAAVIDGLHALGKPVYVLSAGVRSAVVDFAARLNIPASHVYAVDVYFDALGNYRDFDHDSPLAGSHGKSLIVQQLKKQHATIAHIGDGMNDVEAARVVDRFIGYGGVCYRPSIARLSPYYIRSLSLAPVFPLLLADGERERLPCVAQRVYDKGREMFKREVEIRDF